MFKIYLVEDEQNLNDILVFYLKNEGYEVKSFTCGLDAEKCIEEDMHLWILDIMLPDLDGYELIKRIKKHNENIPVIFISARDTDLDIITGLQMGSDDYISKPFLPMELVIRTRKLLKRVYKQEGNNNILINNKYKIDFNKRMVYSGDKVIELTSREFDFLCTIIENKNNAMSRDCLLNKVWGEDYYGSDRVVDDLVRRVRKKLPDIRIETIYGYGYRWCEIEN
ncbi:response regulator transcription factor [Vallitalea guaymasensis]|nr:response regulator transcription factor [Vallitalea guaymasensis]